MQENVVPPGLFVGKCVIYEKSHTLETDKTHIRPHIPNNNDRITKTLALRVLK
jgi:hypothetical protein